MIFAGLDVGNQAGILTHRMQNIVRVNSGFPPLATAYPSMTNFNSF